MAKFQISTFLIAIVVVGVIAGGIGLIFTSFASEYGMDYDNTSLESYNELQSMNTVTEDLKDKSSNLGETSIIDIVGGWITQAYNSLRVTLDSMNMFGRMTDGAIDNLNAGPMTELVKTLLMSVMVIAIVLGVVLTAIMKWEL